MVFQRTVFTSYGLHTSMFLGDVRTLYRQIKTPQTRWENPNVCTDSKQSSGLNPGAMRHQPYLLDYCAALPQSFTLKFTLSEHQSCCSSPEWSRRLELGHVVLLRNTPPVFEIKNQQSAAFQKLQCIGSCSMYSSIMLAMILALWVNKNRFANDWSWLKHVQK